MRFYAVRVLAKGNKVPWPTSGPDIEASDCCLFAAVMLQCS